MGDSVEPSDTQKSYNQVLAQEIQAGLQEFDRSSSSLFLSSVSAGLDLGFTLLTVAAIVTLAHGQSELVRRLLIANAYTVGFIFVILGRSELFTEHTTLAVLPVLDRQRSLGELGVTWGIIYVGNLIGGLIFAVFAIVIGPEFGIFEHSVLSEIVKPYIIPSTFGLFGGAVLAGWLMGLLSWLVTAVRDSVGRIFFVWFTTLLIGFTHLPHSIAGHIEMTAAVLATPLGIASYGHFLFVATLGNAIGGVFFVALVKYGHVARESTNESSFIDDYIQIDQQSKQNRTNNSDDVDED